MQVSRLVETWFPESLVALCACEYDVDPYAHSFRRWCHQIVAPLVSLEDEGKVGIRGFYRIGMIQVNLLDGLKQFRIARYFSSSVNFCHNYNTESGGLVTFLLENKRRLSASSRSYHSSRLTCVGSCQTRTTAATIRSASTLFCAKTHGN